MQIVISKLITLFFIYSVTGWIMETVNCLIREKRFVNRGFLIGAYCPIYGFGCISIIVLLNKYLEDPIALFILASIICSTLEYITSFIMEKLFKARWWDYSSKKFNINGRICLGNSIIFGTLAFLIMYFVNPFFLKCIEKIPNVALVVISYVILVIMLSDFVISVILMFKIKKISFEAKKDNTYEITKTIKERIKSSNLFIKRIGEAFPNLKSTLKSKREEIEEKKDEILANIKKNIHVTYLGARKVESKKYKIKEDKEI